MGRGGGSPRYLCGPTQASSSGRRAAVGQRPLREPASEAATVLRATRDTASFPAKSCAEKALQSPLKGTIVKLFFNNWSWAVEKSHAKKLGIESRQERLGAKEGDTQLHQNWNSPFFGKSTLIKRQITDWEDVFSNPTSEKGGSHNKHIKELKFH